MKLFFMYIAAFMLMMVCGAILDYRYGQIDTEYQEVLHGPH